MAEWFKAAVLKTVVGNSHRGFESYLLRLGTTLEMCLSGRKEQFAKLSYGVTCTQGSNPCVSESSKLSPDPGK
ncbi:hypothetical protein LPTSP1_27890 [Leptospira johnsonii]|uniref:Uncharacterized protein n=1 Tax=Leptospira johnsonii TaxID=1917820 RepID=A0A2P2D563_9LEPT|nr:hypothetical protein LPTSP1_27890 [Leptospira johnsonii]